jgi:hypothetical protein
MCICIYICVYIVVVCFLYLKGVQAGGVDVVQALDVSVSVLLRGRGFVCVNYVI